MATKSNKLDKQTVLYCGASLGIGLALGYFVSKWMKKPAAYSKLATEHIDYIRNRGNRCIPELQEIYDITYTQNKFGCKFITAVDQCYFFKWLMQTMRCRKALEIGVFTGSSALAIAKGLTEDGKLRAFDVNKEYTDVARQMWKKAGVDHKIELSLDGGIQGIDALSSNQNELGTYDFAYIDAIKAEYGDYYEKLLPLMRKGGVIAFDNVLWSGKVSNCNYDVSDDETTKYLREFNQKLNEDERIDMCMITLGDGILFATVK
eukprot:14718_1